MKDPLKLTKLKIFIGEFENKSKFIIYIFIIIKIRKILVRILAPMVSRKSYKVFLTFQSICKESKHLLFNISTL